MPKHKENSSYNCILKFSIFMSMRTAAHKLLMNHVTCDNITQDYSCYHGNGIGAIVLQVSKLTGHKRKLNYFSQTLPLLPDPSIAFIDWTLAFQVFAQYKIVLIYWLAGCPSFRGWCTGSSLYTHSHLKNVCIWRVSTQATLMLALMWY